MQPAQEKVSYGQSNSTVYITSSSDDQPGKVTMIYSPGNYSRQSQSSEDDSPFPLVLKILALVAFVAFDIFLLLNCHVFIV